MRTKPIHPGIIFKEMVLEGFNISIDEAVKNLNVPEQTLSQFINEKSVCSPEMALRIGRTTDTTPQFWLNLQTDLDLWYAEQKEFKVTPFPKISFNQS